MEFLVIENAVEGVRGLGPHYADVWFNQRTKKDNQCLVTLYLGPVVWTGEQLRIEEFAKQVAMSVRNMNDTGSWQVCIEYDEERHRWSAQALHTHEGQEGLSRTYTEWGGG